MYMGAATVASPMPTPPMNRATMSDGASHASPDQTADTKYSTPIQNSVGLRPKRCAGQAPKIDPSTVPYSADAMTIP
jgi:hypothetical protein